MKRRIRRNDAACMNRRCCPSFTNGHRCVHPFCALLLLIHLFCPGTMIIHYRARYLLNEDEGRGCFFSVLPGNWALAILNHEHCSIIMFPDFSLIPSAVISDTRKFHSSRYKVGHGGRGFQYCSDLDNGDWKCITTWKLLPCSQSAINYRSCLIFRVNSRLIYLTMQPNPNFITERCWEQRQALVDNVL